jgi:uncharacterized protein (DUF885 family)
MKTNSGRLFSFSVLLVTCLLLITSCSSSFTEKPLIVRTPLPSFTEGASSSPSGVEGISSTVESILFDLEGLSLQDFFEESFRQLSLRYPENLVSLGLEDSIGLEGVTLDNISDEYVKDTQALESGILELMKGYDRASLSPEDQISYDVYEWYLDDLVRGHEFMYFNYPFSFFIYSVHISTEFFFTDSYQILDKQDAENYVTRLSLVDKKFSQLIGLLKTREEMGIIPPKFAIEWGIPSVTSIAYASPSYTPYYTTFKDKLDALTSLSETDKQDLLDSAETAIRESVIPAYQALNSYLNELVNKAPTKDGVWQFENGEAYYEYALRHYTSTDLTPDEIHELGLRELDRIHSEMRVIFDELGYPEDESLYELFERVATDGGIIPNYKMIDTFQALIDELDSLTADVFITTPKEKVAVVGAPGGEFYSPGSVDGSRPGTFYATMSGGGKAYYLLPSLVYHETIPGHHTQIALAHELNLPSFRNFIDFNSYTEGWALYAERLAWEMGLYEDDPYGDLGRLSYEALRAARLVVDTGIHTKGWDFDQAVEFFMDNVGWDRQSCEYQIARYIVLPGQSTGYMVGMLKILELRDKAMEELGDKFDLKEFHQVVLGSGGVPLSVLEEIIDEYIADTLASDT